MSDIERSESWEAISEAALVSAMRRAQPQAVDEFIRRFVAMVHHYSRELGVPGDARGQWVADVLFDVALTIAEPDDRLPAGLAACVLAACMRMRPRTELASC